MASTNPHPSLANQADLEHLLNAFAARDGFDERCVELLADLRSLDDADLAALGKQTESCPVCRVPFAAIVAEEEHAQALNTPAHPSESLGVTKLSKPWQCGHIFCRKDITKWIRDGNDSCPLCRKSLLDSSVQAHQSNSSPSDREDPLEILRRFGIPLEAMDLSEFADMQPPNRAARDTYVPDAGYNSMFS